MNIKFKYFHKKITLTRQVTIQNSDRKWQVLLHTYSCRVHLGNLGDFVNTSCVTNLTFITEAEDSPDGN